MVRWVELRVWRLRDGEGAVGEVGDRPGRFDARPGSVGMGAPIWVPVRGSHRRTPVPPGLLVATSTPSARTATRLRVPTGRRTPVGRRVAGSYIATKAPSLPSDSMATAAGEDAMSFCV